MEHPQITDIQESHKWLSWKISPEGTYLKVMPESVPKSWDIKEIRKTLLKNEVMNFDISKIEKVIKSASGEMELVGPSFEFFEKEKRKYLHLQATPIQARFSIDVGILATNCKISVADIAFILAEKSVVYGIDYDIIEEIVSNEIYGQEFIIASANPPVMGSDAVITEVVAIDPDVKPFLDENGNVDYKKWDNIRQIKQGETICTRVPPTPGIPGTSIYGHALSPNPGEDLALPFGRNTKIIDNETKMVAAIDGFLYRYGRDICVGNVYIIEGDVNVKTGNINYSGDVLVKGSVNTGFSVTADGNISINGFVEAARIESKKNSVFLKGSVFGLNKTTITAEKNITAENIQDAVINAGKTIIVRGHIIGCKIKTENLQMPSGGNLINSSVEFRGRVKCGVIGGKSESLNEFTLVENEREQYKEELAKINEMLLKLDKAINALQYRLLTSKTQPQNAEIQEQVKLFSSQLSTCVDNKEQFTAKRKNLIRLIEIMPDRNDLIIVRRIAPVLKVNIFGRSREFKQELTDLKISWKNGAIRMDAI